MNDWRKFEGKDADTSALEDAHTHDDGIYANEQVALAAINAIARIGRHAAGEGADHGCVTAEDHNGRAVESAEPQPEHGAYSPGTAVVDFRDFDAETPSDKLTGKERAAWYTTGQVDSAGLTRRERLLLDELRLQGLEVRTGREYTALVSRERRLA